MRRPKIKPYVPSEETLELQRKQVEEMNEKKAEIAERQLRASRSNLRKSLIASIADVDAEDKDTLGVA